MYYLNVSVSFPLFEEIFEEKYVLTQINILLFDYFLILQVIMKYNMHDIGRL